MTLIDKSNIDVCFFEDFLKQEKNFKDSTIFQYTNIIRRFLMGQPNIEKLEDYNDFIIKHGVKKRNTHYYSVLKLYISWKITDSSLKSRLIENLIIPPERHGIKRERRYLTFDEMSNIIINFNEYKHQVVAMIQRATGVRAGDILRLKVGNIKPEVYEGKSILRLIIHGKGGKRNIVPIYDNELQKIILSYITKNPGVEGYYFLQFGKMKNRKGSSNEFRLYQMNYQWYWEDLKQALQTAGIDKDDFATHDFRRCFARRVWENNEIGHDIQKLQRALNHSNPMTSMGYLEQSGLSNIDIHKKMQQEK